MFYSESKTRQAQFVQKSKIKPKLSSKPAIFSAPRMKAPDNEPTNQTPRYNQNKSKFTILNNSKTVTTSGLATAIKRENLKPEVSKKSLISLSPKARSTSIQRDNSLNRKPVNRKNQTSTESLKRPETEAESVIESAEIGIQTIENEILNHSLIVGDLKIVLPSHSLIVDIEKMRREQETKNLLKATRKFEEHSQKEEKHLDALKEYLDKNYVTRKPPKMSINIMEEDHKIIESMDRLLQRERPKVESITDIRSRIKHKEQELLSLFDHFQKKTELFGKPDA